MTWSQFSEEASLEIITQKEEEEGGHLPVHGMECVRLVVVSPLVMAHVNRDRRVEGWEDVVGGYNNREAKKKKKKRVSRGRQRGREETSKKEERNFKGKRATIKQHEFQSKLSTFV